MKKRKKRVANHQEDGECGCKYSEEYGYLCEHEAESFNDGMKAYKDFLPNKEELENILNHIDVTFPNHHGTQKTRLQASAILQRINNE